MIETSLERIRKQREAAYNKWRTARWASRWLAQACWDELIVLDIAYHRQMHIGATNAKT